MNAVWELSRSRIYNKIINRICDHFNIANLYVIQPGSRDAISASEVSPLIREEFDYHRLIVADYSSYVYFDEMEPLDKKLLDAMSPYEPEALKMLERAYGNNNPAESRFIQYHRHLRYWNTFLKKADIGIVIFNYPPHAWFDYILMRLCQVKGIPTVMEDVFHIPELTGCVRDRLVCNYEEYDDYVIRCISEYKNKYKSAEDVMLPDDIERVYERFTFSKKQLFSTSTEPRHPFLDRVIFFRKLCEEQNGAYALRRLTSHYKNKSRTKKLLKRYDRISVRAGYNDKYIYFPLHLQPEMSISPLGGWFVHQYLAVQMLSYYVPEDVFVYVKEHPAMRALPSNVCIFEHYEQMMHLRNVKLISMDEDSQELIENSLAVASITGSVGFESLFKKKPYIMFGYEWMRYGPGTINVRDNEECRNAIMKVVNGDIKFDDRDIRIFLKVFGDITTRFEPKETEEADESVRETNIDRLYKMYERAIDKSISRHRFH